MKFCMSGKQKSKRGKGLEVSWLVIVKALGHIFSKLEPIIKDMRILYKCFKKVAVSMQLLTANKRNLILEKQGRIKAP